jgi:outer membrane protein OmpA-like peptidoglycan-associated protein/ABC-type nitrate/sulfonate/bicarbonate transport system substrate-binding protein
MRASDTRIAVDASFVAASFMEKLTPLSKFLIVGILSGSSVVAARTHGHHFHALTAKSAAGSSASAAPGASEKATAPAGVAASQNHADPNQPKTKTPFPARPVRVALSQWPGHMPLVIAAAGMRTQPGSPAAALGLDVEIVFIEDAPSKNKALMDGSVDFVWQTVDELPISMGSYKAAGVEPKAFLQIDWSRGGDACVASAEVRTVEDILGRRSATLLFSPDHTVFEFMITNSRLTPEQVAGVRKATQFSPDDFTFARTLFTQGKIEVACLWEPDVTLALASRPGSHRLFSTADATELVADVLLGKKQLLDEHPEIPAKIAKAWFAAVADAERDRPAAARLISTVASRFRDELGYEKTLAALSWAKWTDLGDNARFFGLDGSAPAFDRVYNQADGIWINYPEAEIKDRFAPVVLRDDRIVKKLWEQAGKPSAKAEPPNEPELARSGTPVFVKMLSVNFATASSRLTHEAIAMINQQVLPQLQMAGGMSVRIEGNTDNVGQPEENQTLSEHRAQAILEYLVARGVAANRLVARGNGSRNPMATNGTAEGRAQNRRTEILFIKGSKG